MKEQQQPDAPTEEATVTASAELPSIGKALSPSTPIDVADPTHLLQQQVQELVADVQRLVDEHILRDPSAFSLLSRFFTKTPEGQIVGAGGGAALLVATILVGASAVPVALFAGAFAYLINDYSQCEDHKSAQVKQRLEPVLNLLLCVAQKLDAHNKTLKGTVEEIEKSSAQFTDNVSTHADKVHGLQELVETQKEMIAKLQRQIKANQAIIAANQQDTEEQRLNIAQAKKIVSESTITVSELTKANERNLQELAVIYATLKEELARAKELNDRNEQTIAAMMTLGEESSQQVQSVIQSLHNAEQLRQQEHADTLRHYQKSTAELSALKEQLLAANDRYKALMANKRD